MDSTKSSRLEGAGFKSEKHNTVPEAYPEIPDLLTDNVVDPIYHTKARILNDALQEIGMGKYQWKLFTVTGFGWLADNIWLTITALILPPLVNEFHFKAPFLRLGQGVGLLIGAAFWGIGSDVWGRRISFNITLLIIAVFSAAAGGQPSGTTFIIFAGLWSVGVGGNLPVDSSIFLEFTPPSHQYLLTVSSIFWAVGQLISSLIAWPLIANFSCPTTVPPTPCPSSSNQGWRYFLFTMSGFMFLLWGFRFFFFQFYESPKYLMGRGRDEQAVAVVHNVASYNGKTSSLTLVQLQSAGSISAKDEAVFDASATGAIQRQLARFTVNHVKALFATRKLAYSTSLLMVIWAVIGLAFPLYSAYITFFLATRGAHFGDSSVYITYRNQVILGVVGVPGAVLAGWLVELPYLGRRGTLSISAIVSGIFILLATTARTSNALLGWNCGYNFSSKIVHSVLFTLTPEVFPTKDRGTGNGLVAIPYYITGLMSPIIALYTDLMTSVPIYISGALFVLSGFIALLLPFEPRGHAAI